MNTNQIILGIDPGTTVMGYGLIKIENKQMYLITLGVLELHKFKDHFQKLKLIFDRTLHLIDQYQVTELSIEAPFYAKNVQSMLKLGRAQGIAMAAALHRSLPIYEYLPRKIKMAITGNGNASKEQVAAFLKSLLKIPSVPEALDATDGLAAAVCHYYQNRIVSDLPAQAKSWKEFIAKNPNRIV